MNHTTLNPTTTIHHNPTNPNLNYTSTNPCPPNFTYNNNPHNFTSQQFNANPNPNLFNSHEFYGGGAGGGSVSLQHTVATPFASGINPFTYFPANQHQSGADAYGFESVGTGVAPSTCYQDPNTQNWATVMEATRQHGIDPAAFGARAALPTNEPQQLTATLSTLTSWPNATIPPSKTSKWKRIPKKTKIVQSLYCETCKVDCSSRVVYEGHIQGKKHKKNMEKLQIPVAQAPNASTQSTTPVIASQEIVAVAQKAKSKKPTLEDLETKRRKVLEGGAAANAVRLCIICNVVCNSDVVFNVHLSGQKHATMVNKTKIGATL